MRCLALGLAVAAAAPAAVGAQSAASIGVHAGVSTEALTIVRTTPLEFGPVLPGVAATVNPRTAANAGEFELRGLRRAQITATFSLPTELTVGPYSMPIAFNGQSGCHDKDTRGSCKFFDPRVPFTGEIGNKPVPQNAYFFWVGGTVNLRGENASRKPGRHRKRRSVVSPELGGPSVA